MLVHEANGVKTPAKQASKKTQIVTDDAAFETPLWSDRSNRITSWSQINATIPKLLGRQYVYNAFRSLDVRIRTGIMPDGSAECHNPFKKDDSASATIYTDRAVIKLWNEGGDEYYLWDAAAILDRSKTGYEWKKHYAKIA